MGIRDAYCNICGAPTHTTLMRVFKDKSIIKKLKKYVPDAIEFDDVEEILELNKMSEDAYYEFVTELITKDVSKGGAKYKWLENLILLHKSGKLIMVKFNDYYDYVDSSGKSYMPHFEFEKTSHCDGFIVHKDCYKIIEKKYGKSFKYGDIDLSNKIKRPKIKKYDDQFNPWMKYSLNGDQYLLESPLKNMKNKSRILKINIKFKKTTISRKPASNRKPSKKKKSSKK